MQDYVVHFSGKNPGRCFLRGVVSCKCFPGRWPGRGWCFFSLKKSRKVFPARERFPGAFSRKLNRKGKITVSTRIFGFTDKIHWISKNIRQIWASWTSSCKQKSLNQQGPVLHFFLGFPGRVPEDDFLFVGIGRLGALAFLVSLLIYQWAQWARDGADNLYDLSCFFWKWFSQLLELTFSGRNPGSNFSQGVVSRKPFPGSWAGRGKSPLTLEYRQELFWQKSYHIYIYIHIYIIYRVPSSRKKLNF